MKSGAYGFQALNSYLGRLPERMRRGAREALTDSTLLVERKVKEIIATGRNEWPSLSEATVRGQITRFRNKRGAPRGVRDHILNVTADYMRQVTHEIEDEMAIVGTPREDAPAHEFGTNRAGRGRKVRIPGRPHFKPGVEEALPGIKATFLKRAEQAGRK